MWKRRVSIPVPRACEARALPIELRSRFFDSVQKCTTYIQSALAHPWDEGECTSSDKDSEARSTCDCMVAGSIPTQGKAIQPQLFLSWRQLQTNVGCDLEGSQAPQLLKFSSAMVSVPSTFESHLSEK